MQGSDHPADPSSDPSSDQSGFIVYDTKDYIQIQWVNPYTLSSTVLVFITLTAVIIGAYLGRNRIKAKIQNLSRRKRRRPLAQSPEGSPEYFVLPAQPAQPAAPAEPVFEELTPIAESSELIELEPIAEISNERESLSEVVSEETEFGKISRLSLDASLVFDDVDFK